MKKVDLNRNEVTKQQLISDLTRLGVCKGDHLAVVLSFKKVGYVRGGPNAFIDALIEIVGSEGTIMMNTHTPGVPIYAIDEKFVFDSKSTPCWTGVVPETLRKRKEAVRSNNPMYSVTAIGKKADYLIQDHLNSSSYVPYSRLSRINGKYLAIGLGNKLVAIRHQAQRQAGLYQIVTRPIAIKYKDFQGKNKLFVSNWAPCTTRIEELTPIIKNAGILKTGKIGNGQALISSAKELSEFLTNNLKKDPTLNLCDSGHCLWCRELERILDLYKKVKVPRYFQKYVVIQKLVALRNRFRLIKYNYVSYLTEKKSNPQFRIPLFTNELNRLVEDLRWAIIDFFKLRSKFYFHPRVSKNKPSMISIINNQACMVKVKKRINGN